MEKITILSKVEAKVPKCVDIGPKPEEKPKNDKNISLMFFWDMIPKVIYAYDQYCGALNKIYSIKHNFIKCDTNGKRTKEIGK